MYSFPVTSCTSDDKGEGFAASRDLGPLEIVLRVAPIVAVPKDEYISSVCACCFQDFFSDGATKLGPLRREKLDAEDRVTDVHAQKPHSDPAPQSLLQKCEGCSAVSFCPRCLQSPWVQSKHAEECQALRELLQLKPIHEVGMTSADRSKVQPSKRVKGNSSHGCSRRSKSRKNDHAEKEGEQRD
jgi:hypothetical protein